MRLHALPLLLILLGPAAAAPPDPVSLLQKAVTQSDRVPFSGRQVMILWTQDGSAATITEEDHAGDGRARVETRWPNRVRGRLTLTDRRHVWQYDPARRTAVRSDASPVGGELTDLERLLRGYTAKVAPDPETIAGRRAWLVEITPRVEGKPHRRLWIDDGTGIILKQEKLHADDQPISTSYFTAVRFTRPSPSLFAIRFPPRTRLVEHAGDARPVTPADVETQFQVKAPVRLAEGYEFESARWIGSGEKRAAHLRYHDGLSTLSLFVVSHGGPVPYGSRSARKVALRGGEGRLVSQHHITALTWRTPQADCALVGDMSEALIRTLAESTGLTHGAQESHHSALLPRLWLIPAALLLLALILAAIQQRQSRARRARRIHRAAAVPPAK